MSYNSPISIISQMADEQIKEMHKQEEAAIMSEITRQIGIYVDKDELIKALNYDRQQYEKGYAAGRFFGIGEVKSKLVHLNHCISTAKDFIEYLGEDEDRTAEYKEFVKRQICNEIGRYLYENKLVAFTESDGFDNSLVIKGDVQIYNEGEDNYGIST